MNSLFIFECEGGKTMKKTIAVLTALGEGTEWYGSWYWEGENDSVINLSGTNDFIFVDFGINTDGK